MKKLFSLFALILTATSALLAQDGTLQGRIMDGSKKDEGVSFATVVLLRNGSQVTGAVADIDGNYIIKPIQPGTYDLTVSFLGYASSTLTGIQIEGDKITTVNTTLKLAGGVQLEEIKVYEKKLIDPDKTSTGGTASHTADC